MRRFIVVISLFSVSVLAVWAVFQASIASLPKINDDNTQLEVQNAGNKADIPVTGVESRRIAPVFDSTGAVVSDPTGTLWSAMASDNSAIPVVGASFKVAPVFDATGALVSDPTGTIGNVTNP